MRDICFIDCETTGLRPGHHEAWEIACMRQFSESSEWFLHRWLIKPRHLEHADSGALRLNRYYETAWEQSKYRQSDKDQEILTTVAPNAHDYWYVAHSIATFTAGKYLVGAQTHFDAQFTAAYLYEFGVAPAWHHRLIDVESMAIGFLPENHGLPRSLSDTARALEIEVDSDERHGAVYDVRLAKAVYEKLETDPPGLVRL